MISTSPVAKNQFGDQPLILLIFVPLEKTGYSHCFIHVIFKNYLLKWTHAVRPMTGFLFLTIFYVFINNKLLFPKFLEISRMFCNAKKHCFQISPRLKFLVYFLRPRKHIFLSYIFVYFTKFYRVLTSIYKNKFSV